MFEEKQEGNVPGPGDCWGGSMKWHRGRLEPRDVILKVMNDLLILWLLENTDQNRTRYQAECQLFCVLA